MVAANTPWHVATRTCVSCGALRGSSQRHGSSSSTTTSFPSMSFPHAREPLRYRRGMRRGHSSESAMRCSTRASVQRSGRCATCRSTPITPWRSPDLENLRSTTQPHSTCPRVDLSRRSESRVPTQCSGPSGSSGSAQRSALGTAFRVASGWCSMLRHSAEPPCEPQRPRRTSTLLRSLPTSVDHRCSW